jgi:hypothetical protein
MKIFKTGSYTWWQIGLLKLALLCIGVSIGAYWSAIFLPYITLLLMVGVVLGLYIWYVWMKQ